MGEDRRYRDSEIREIFELAQRSEDAGVPALPAADGLTLAELEEVGREVGVPREQLARAVAEFEGRGQILPRGTALGMPSSVGRTVPLPRAPTEREWELLIAELRTTFGAKGEVTSHGGLREWSNVYMHAFIEPTAEGYRLRLADSISGAAAMPVIGGFFIAFALLILIVLLGKDDPGFRFVVPAFFTLIGGGMIVGTRVALPRWADERERQMEHITQWATALIGAPESDDDEG
jgi:hypothetical protein